MERMKDVLRFLSELDFADKIDIDCFEKIEEIKRMVVREFEDYKFPKMVYALKFVDEIKLSVLTYDLD